MAEALATLVNAEYALVVATPAWIYYARDGFGRRSLLLFQSERAFRLASVAMSTDWTEVPPGVVYCYSLETGTITELNISCCCPILPTALAIEPPHPHTSAGTCPLDCSETMWQASLAFEHLLQQAVQRRLCSNLQQQQQSIGVLFSGGLDSVVLASMVCALRHPVDLYNISFGGNKSRDRLAALASFQELKALYPATLATLHCIDKTWEDIQAVEDRVRVLLYPKDSVMDINIGCALWFASAASGGGRILLVGMGADEQLGGYTRHRSAAREGTLREEMDRDVNRLWERNLGRDDRLLADHGKEGRFPFLDCHVVQFLKTLPVDDICDFSLPPGQGDKRILRMIAQRHGLVACSGLVKRAIQFGSRISHVSDTQRFGSRRQAKGEKRFDAKKKEKVSGVVIHGDGTVVVRGS